MPALKMTRSAGKPKNERTALKAAVPGSKLAWQPSFAASQRVSGSSCGGGSEIEDTAAQVMEIPYKASYFLPGQLEGRRVQFRLDAGCTTNLLSKQVFDKLPRHVTLMAYWSMALSYLSRV